MGDDQGPTIRQRWGNARQRRVAARWFGRVLRALPDGAAFVVPAGVPCRVLSVGGAS